MSPLRHGLLPYMEQGRHFRSLRCMQSSMLCPQPRNPAYGCVAPHILTTLVPTSDARCIFAESIVSITSSSLINCSSSLRFLQYSDARCTLGYLSAHSCIFARSSPPPPKRITFFALSLGEGVFLFAMSLQIIIRTTSSILSSGYIFPLWAAKGAMPIRGLRFEV